MKWIVIALLAMNISLFGYQFWLHQQPAEAGTVAQESKFNNLKLSEGQQQRLDSIGSKPAQEESKPVTQCIRISGLSENDSYPVIESRLRALEISSEKKDVRLLNNTDYQVMIGPFASQEQARAEMDRIAALNIESYVITSGDRANSLSLGVFSSLENANRRRDELFAQDVVATVYENEHYIDGVLLEIGSESAALISDEALSGMLSDLEEVKFIRYKCD